MKYEDLGVKFYDLNNIEINVSSIILNNNIITSIIDTKGTSYNKQQFTTQAPLLHIEGVGDVPPYNTCVIWKNNRYKLCFGWHINISNQNLFSWYLVPIKTEETPQVITNYDSLSIPKPSIIRTLYKEMIPEITGVYFSNNLSEETDCEGYYWEAISGDSTDTSISDTYWTKI